MHGGENVISSGRKKKTGHILKSLKIIWVFSKKKDAESDLSFSLMYQHPAEDTEKQLFVESSPQGKEAAGLGLEASRDKFSVPSSQRSHSPREMLS